MDWNTIADISQGLGLIGATIGLVLNYHQLKANNRQKAAEFIFNLNNNIFQNNEMNEIYFEIEEGKFEYDGKFQSFEKKVALNNLLDHFEIIAKLHLLNNFTVEDLEYLAYYYIVVYQNKSVKVYLDDFDKLYESKGMRIKSYSDFRKVGEILENKYTGKKLLKDNSKKQLEKS